MLSNSFSPFIHKTNGINSINGINSKTLTHSENPNLIFKHNKFLLNKKPASHLILGLNGLIYAPQEKAEVFANSLENQFLLNLGNDIPEVTNSI